jgi:hypothetical protein
MEIVDRDEIIGRCRELVSECLRLLPMTEEQQKPMLLEMAEHWTNLAERLARAEKIDHETSLVPISEQLRAKQEPLPPLPPPTA